jgi:hypothetical protein
MSTFTPDQTLIHAGPLCFIHRGNLWMVAVNADHPDVVSAGRAQHVTFVRPTGADLANPKHDFKPHLTDSKGRHESLGTLTLESLLRVQAFVEARLVERWRGRTFAADLDELEDAGLRVVLPMTNSSLLRSLFEPRRARGKRRWYGVKFDHEIEQLSMRINAEAEQHTVLPTALLHRTDLEGLLMVVDEDGAAAGWLGYFPEGFDQPRPQWIFTPLSWMSADIFRQDIIDYAGVEFWDLMRRAASALGLELRGEA